MVEAIAPSSPTVTQVASSSRSVVPGTMAPKTLTSRPARKQVTHREVENLRQAQDRSNQTGLTYNVWYNKWSGGDNEDSRHNNTKSATRVNIARDAGYTRANAQGGAYICLFFARGYCPNGADCTFLHALPIDSPDQGHDVFGREKHGNYRDDMGGVGSIQRVNRTLYVGHIVEEADSTMRMSMGGGANMPGNGGSKGGQNERKDGKWNAFGNSGKGWDWSMERSRMSDTEKVLFRHFSEFGELERVRVLHTRGCGFITFHREVDAQFAKEAMMHQSLDHDECINLRWATDDPNPVAQKRDRHEREKQGIEAMKANMSEDAIAAGQSLLDLEQASREAQDGELAEHGEEKRRRIEGPEEMGEEEYQKLLEENQRNWEEIDRQDEELQTKAMAEIEAEQQGNGSADVNHPSADAVQVPRAEMKSSIIDSKALMALQAMRNKQQLTAQSKSTSSALGGLADYGSDSD